MGIVDNFAERIRIILGNGVQQQDFPRMQAFCHFVESVLLAVDHFTVIVICEGPEDTVISEGRLPDP